MKVRAPGKVLVSGAYAVLEGAPAIVLAIDRYAVAEAPDRVDTSSMFDGADKLGLGSSAAFLVASLGFAAAARGEDLASASVRRALFDEARAAHARMQSGGSGVDIAASVYGGALRYGLGASGASSIDPVGVPEGLAFAVFWSGASARTIDLRARVDAWKARDPEGYAQRMDWLRDTSMAIAQAFANGDVATVIEASNAAESGLERLGAAADAPIVTFAMYQLAEQARARGAAFLPSGAGGGDVAIWLGASAPDGAFVASAAKLGMRPLAIGVDRDGVRTME